MSKQAVALNGFEIKPHAFASVLVALNGDEIKLRLCLCRVCVVCVHVCVFRVVSGVTRVFGVSFIVYVCVRVCRDECVCVCVRMHSHEKRG